MFAHLRSIVLPCAALSVLCAGPLGTPQARADLAPTTPTYCLKWGINGTTPGHLSNPSAVAVDALGNVFVVDQSNQRIQKFDYLGNLITYWGSSGSGDGQFTGPNYVAVDASGNVYVTDGLNARVQKFTSSGAFITKWGSAGSGDGQFNAPQGVAVDAAGNVYVAEQNNNRIQKFTSGGAFLGKWGSYGGGDGQFDQPTGVAVDKVGNVFVVENNGARVQKFTSAGVFLNRWGTYGSGNGQFTIPKGIAVDPIGNVYVSEQGNHRIQKFKADGTYLTTFGFYGTGDGQVNAPSGLGVDAAGNIYVPEYLGNRVQKFSGAGVTQTYATPSFVLTWGSFGSAPGQFGFPAGLALDAAGNVYVTDHSSDRIQKFTSVGTYLSQWGSGGSGPGQFNGPAGIAIDAAGNVYVADDAHHRIQKFSGSGTYLTQWGSNGSGNGQFESAWHVAVDAASNVYASDLGNGRVQKFTSVGGYLSQWTSPGAEGVALDGFGNVYVADRFNSRIQKFTNNGTLLGQWGSFGSGNGQLHWPETVATDATGNIYVCDLLNNRIQKFNSSGAYLTQWGSVGSGNGQFGQARSATIDAAGNIYVGDGDNYRIQKFATPPQIALVSDVPTDQGEQVQLRMFRCSADSPGAGVAITGYEIYRRDDVLPGPTGPAGIQLAGWTLVGSFAASGATEYYAVVPTLANGNATSVFYTAFMVRAITANPLKFFDSVVEYGYSTDNLSPPAPSPFTAAYTTGATHLHWGVNAATDFASFRLYRGSSADFTPGPGSFVIAKTDTGHVDAGAAGSYYKLSAVDLEGNEGPYATVGPDQTTDVVPEAPVAFGLEAIRPNPTSSRNLTVRFSLPVRAPARLELVDVAGRLVATQEVGDFGPGSHAVDLGTGTRWRPGLFFVRLRQGTGQKIERVIVLE